MERIQVVFPIFLFCIFAFSFARTFLESRKVKWVSLHVPFEEFYFNFSKIEKKRTQICGHWKSSCQFEMYYIPQGMRFMVNTAYILKLRGTLRADRVDYSLSGHFAYCNRNDVKELLQEKLYEMCNSMQAEE